MANSTNVSREEENLTIDWEKANCLAFQATKNSHQIFFNLNFSIEELPQMTSYLKLEFRQINFALFATNMKKHLNIFFGIAKRSYGLLNKEHEYTSPSTLSSVNLSRSRSLP